MGTKDVHRAKNPREISQQKEIVWVPNCRGVGLRVILAFVATALIFYSLLDTNTVLQHMQQGMPNHDPPLTREPHQTRPLKLRPVQSKSAAACVCSQCLVPHAEALDLFSIYLSQPGDVSRGLRAALRLTSLSLIPSNFSVGYCFMLSPPAVQNATEMALLEEELNAHGDLTYFDASIATRDLARKVHLSLGNISSMEPPPQFIAKLDDDSMLRYDNVLPELRKFPPGTRLYWGRHSWDGTYLSNYIMSSEVAAAIAALPLPDDCFYNEDVCMGKLAELSGLVTYWGDDERWFIKGPDEGWDPQLCPWCAVWPGPNDDSGTMCAHHVYESDMRKWWAARAVSPET